MLTKQHIEAPPITNEILKLIAEIDEFKGGWRAFKNLAPDRLEALRKVATIESVASSTRIEGVKLSDKEVEALLSNLDLKQFKTRDEQEVAGYAEVMETIFNAYASIPISENHIKQLHSVLLKFSDKDIRHRGTYKTLSNSVQAFDADGKSMGVIFETSTPFDTPFHMEALLRYINQNLNDGVLHPLIVIGIFIVWFLAIHPFQDGNGRLSRILTMLLLLKQGYVYVPYSSMEHIIEKNKESYYLALRKTQASLKENPPNWEPWLLFFFRTLKEQKDNLLRKIESEQIFLGALPELSVSILDLVKGKGRITIAEIMLLTQAKRSTIKSQLTNLVKKRLLVQHGKARGSWYSLS